jgi:hypothetical protein
MRSKKNKTKIIRKNKNKNKTNKKIIRKNKNKTKMFKGGMLPEFSEWPTLTPEEFTLGDSTPKRQANTGNRAGIVKKQPTVLALSRDVTHGIMFDGKLLDIATQQELPCRFVTPNAALRMSSETAVRELKHLQPPLGHRPDVFTLINVIAISMKYLNDLWMNQSIQEAIAYRTLSKYEIKQDDTGKFKYIKVDQPDTEPFICLRQFRETADLEPCLMMVRPGGLNLNHHDTNKGYIDYITYALSFYFRLARKAIPLLKRELIPLFTTLFGLSDKAEHEGLTIRDMNILFELEKKLFNFSFDGNFDGAIAISIEGYTPGLYPIPSALISVEMGHNQMELQMIRLLMQTLSPEITNKEGWNPHNTLQHMAFLSLTETEKPQYLALETDAMKIAYLDPIVKSRIYASSPEMLAKDMPLKHFIAAVIGVQFLTDKEDYDIIGECMTTVSFLCAAQYSHDYILDGNCRLHPSAMEIMAKVRPENNKGVKNMRNNFTNISAALRPVQLKFVDEGTYLLRVDSMPVLQFSPFANCTSGLPQRLQWYSPVDLEELIDFDKCPFFNFNSCFTSTDGMEHPRMARASSPDGGALAVALKRGQFLYAPDFESDAIKFAAKFRFVEGYEFNVVLKTAISSGPGALYMPVELNDCMTIVEPTQYPIVYVSHTGECFIVEHPDNIDTILMFLRIATNDENDFISAFVMHLITTGVVPNLEPLGYYKGFKLPECLHVVIIALLEYIEQDLRNPRKTAAVSLLDQFKGMVSTKYSTTARLQVAAKISECMEIELQKKQGSLQDDITLCVQRNQRKMERTIIGLGSTCSSLKSASTKAPEVPSIERKTVKSFPSPGSTVTPVSVVVTPGSASAFTYVEPTPTREQRIATAVAMREDEKTAIAIKKRKGNNLPNRPPAGNIEN